MFSLAVALALSAVFLAVLAARSYVSFAEPVSKDGTRYPSSTDQDAQGLAGAFRHLALG